MRRTLQLHCTGEASGLRGLPAILLVMLALGCSDGPGPGPVSVSVSVAPSTVSLVAGGVQDFTATVTNDPEAWGVAWAISGCTGGAATCGTLSNMTSTSATYTAPTPVPSDVHVGITATSVADNTKAASATVAIAAIAVSLSPASPSVAVNSLQLFTATVVNDLTNSGVTWSITGCSGDASACGSLTNVTNAAVTYAAPSIVPPGTLGVTATSVADDSKSSTSVVTIQSPPSQVASLTVAPESVKVGVGSTVVLSTNVTDQFGNALLHQPIAWSSDNLTVATVRVSYAYGRVCGPRGCPRYPTGGAVVTGVTEGATRIVVSLHGKSDTAFITVVPDTVAPTQGRVVTWGNTMMKFNGSSAFRALLGDSAGNTDDYILVRNILQHLTGKTSNVRVLYTDICDPRTDPNVCQIGGMEFLTPFYDMVARIGTITYGDIASVPRADYDVVIADFCSLPSRDYDVLRSYLSTGGPAMVLADNFCWPDYPYHSSAYFANLVMADFGITFSANELFDRSRLQIASGNQTGLLTGVSNLSLFRITPQILSHGFVPIVTESGGNVLYAIQEGATSASAAVEPRLLATTNGRAPAEAPALLGAGPSQSLVAQLVKGERAVVRRD